MIVLVVVAFFLALSLLSWVVYALTHPVDAGRGIPGLPVQGRRRRARAGRGRNVDGQHDRSGAAGMVVRRPGFRRRQPGRKPLAGLVSATVPMAMPNTRASDRFWSKVLKGPGPEDHYLWLGAIADDGYGRYFVLTGGRHTSVRPHRYAYEEAVGTELEPRTTLRHRCNIPICVRPEHLIPGSQRDNMLDRVFDGRHGNGATWRGRGIPRADFAAPSRALRDAALEHGWAPDILHPLMAGTDPDAPTLF